MEKILKTEVDEATHSEVKIAAAKAHLTMRDWLKAVVEKALGRTRRM